MPSSLDPPLTEIEIEYMMLSSGGLDEEYQKAFLPYLSSKI